MPLENSNSSENTWLQPEVRDVIVPAFLDVTAVMDEDWNTSKTHIKNQYTLEDILFKANVAPLERSSGFIGYISQKLRELDNAILEESFYNYQIRDIPQRYQWLINCISKSLINIWEMKDEEAQRKKFIELKNIILDDLYGYLYDFPEVLEINWKPRDCTIEHLIEKCKNLQAQRRRQEIWEGFAEKVMEVFLIDNDTTEDHKIYTYLKSTYSEWWSPKEKELQKLWLQAIIIQAIVESWRYSQVDDIVNPEPELLQEDGEYKLVELVTMWQLEEESKITKHCVGNSKFYYDKIQKWEIHIFSLRAWDKHTTIEYNLKQNRFVQIQGNFQRLLTLSELDILLSTMLATKLKQVAFDYKKIKELSNKENFICWYDNSSANLSQRTYSWVQSLDDYIIIWWVVKCTPQMTIKEVDTLCELPIDIDATLLSEEVKNSITRVAKNLIDTSRSSLEYNSLLSVGWDFICDRTVEISARKIEFVDGGIDYDCAKIVSIPKLRKVVWPLNCTSAKEIHADDLESVGEMMECGNAKKMKFNKLIHIGGYCYCRNATSIEMEALKSIWGALNCANVSDIKLNSLQLIKGALYSEKAKNVEFNALHSIGSNFYCETAENVICNALRSIWGVLNLPEATHVEFKSLDTVGIFYVKSDSFLIDTGAVNIRKVVSGNIAVLKICHVLRLKQWSAVKLPQNPDFPIHYA